MTSLIDLIPIDGADSTSDTTKGAALIGWRGSNVGAYLDNLNSLRTVSNIVATSASQTTFTVPGGYTIGQIDVFLNGFHLTNGTDYIATNGTTVVLQGSVLIASVSVGSTLVVSALSAFSVANTVSATTLASSGGAAAVGFLQTGAGAVTRTVQNKFQDYVSFRDFGAKGDGVTDDTTAILAAVAASRTLYTVDTDVYLMSSTVTLNGGSFVLKGKGTFKLKSGVILNSDSTSTNFTPLFRLQGMSWVDLGECTFDHNRDGQTYPATLTQMGRGSNPYRHNGSVEICPDVTNTTPSTNVHITKASFINSYLNGLVLWQVQDSVIQECQFKNTTWNGIAGAGLQNVKFSKNHGYQCGVSTAWPTERNNGDRASIQVREFPIGFTSSTEGIPCIVTGNFVNGGINVDIEFTGNSGDSCNVETLFGRAIRGLRGSGNRSVNVGYSRHAGASFFPGHFWFEYCEGSFVNNECYQGSVQSGDMQPDGFIGYAMIGDASSQFPFVGNYSLDLRGNRAFSAKNSSGASIPGLLYRGLRVTGNTNCDQTYVDGTDDDGILVINSGSFQTTVTNSSNFSANNSTLLNTNQVSGEGPIGFQRFGSGTTGNPTNIFALNCTTTAETNVVNFNSNLSTFTPTNIQYSNGPGSYVSDTDLVKVTYNAPFYRSVQNTNTGASNVAGFQATSNGGNSILAGSTSSTYSGSLGVALSAFIHATGANTGGLFLTATGGPVVFRPNATRALTLFSTGRARVGSSATDDGVNTLQVEGPIAIKTAGTGLKVTEGSNAKQGVATLVGGTATVANTSVTATSRIFLTSQSDGGTPGFLRVSTRTAGTSFVITSSSNTDTSTVAYEIFEPA